MVTSTEAIVVRGMRAEDVDGVHDLVIAAFEAHIEPGYGSDGVRGFRAYASRTALRQRLADHVTLVAWERASIVGVCQIRDGRHLCMLFVRPDRLRRGIARELLDVAVAACCAGDRDLRAITVLSSPYAVDVYRRLGFVATGGFEDHGGIVAMPMTLALSR